MSRTNLAVIERRRNLESERQAKARAEAAEVAKGVAETIDLSRARGDHIVTPMQGRGERPKPNRKHDGLLFLYNAKDRQGKPRISQAQYDAGRRYERLYRMLESGDVKSCLNVMEAFYGTRPNESQIQPAQAKAMARLKLAQARDALANDPHMIAALDEVCGEGKLPSDARSARRDYEQMETRLSCALTILAKHWDTPLGRGEREQQVQEAQEAAALHEAVERALR